MSTATVTDETVDPEVETGGQDLPPDPDVEPDEPETFDRDYVEKLRKEAAESRVKAKDRDTLAAALWTAQVAATGRLADATDIPMPDDADPLDVEAITAAVDTLLARKPHLASRKPRGDVGQGHNGGATGGVSLSGMLRAGA